MVILTVNTGSSSVRLGLFTDSAGGMRRIDHIRIKTGEGASEDILNHFLQGKDLKI